MSIFVILLQVDIRFYINDFTDYNLRPQKVYSLAITVITMERKIEWKRIEQLIKCMTSSGAPDSQTIADCVLSHCVKQLLHKPQAEMNSEFKDGVDCLIRLINDIELKVIVFISSYFARTKITIVINFRSIRISRVSN